MQENFLETEEFMDKERGNCLFFDFFRVFVYKTRLVFITFWWYGEEVLACVPLEERLLDAESGTAECL